jgi:integrase
MASVSLLPSGKYRVRWRQPSGRQMARTFATKEQAERYGVEQERSKAYIGMPDPDAGRRAFGDYAREVTQRKRVMSVQAAKLDGFLRNHICPTFEHYPIAAITHSMIQEWMKEMADKGLSPSSLQALHTFMRFILQEAVRDKLITVSPCYRIRIPVDMRTAEEKHRYLTKAEVGRLAESIDPRFRVFVEASVVMGWRFGEGTAVKTEEYLRRPEEIFLHSVLGREAGGRIVYRQNSAKNPHSRRRLVVPHFMQLKLKQQATSHDSEWLFPGPDGGMLHPNPFRSRFWLPAVQEAGLNQPGLAPVTPHDLRHTCAAMLIAEGATLLYVSRWLGHRDTRTTERIYLELLQPAMEGVADTLSTIWESD